MTSSNPFRQDQGESRQQRCVTLKDPVSAAEILKQQNIKHLWMCWHDKKKKKKKKIDTEQFSKLWVTYFQWDAHSCRQLQGPDSDMPVPVEVQMYTERHGLLEFLQQPTKHSWCDDRHPPCLHWQFLFCYGIDELVAKIEQSILQKEKTKSSITYTTNTHARTHIRGLQKNKHKVLFTLRPRWVVRSKDDRNILEVRSTPIYS